MGVPDTIHTDQGKNFESNLIKKLCLMLGIRKTRTTPYHPQSDGMVERFNRTLLNMLSIAVGENEKSWDLQLPFILLAYRTSVHDTTGASPFELMYGREVRLPEDVMFALPTTMKTAGADYKTKLKARLQHAYQLVQQHTRRQQDHQKSNYFKLVTWCCCTVHRYPEVAHKNYTGHGKDHTKWSLLGPATYRIMNCVRTKKRLVVHFNRLKPWVSNKEQPDCVPIQNVPGVVPTGRTAVPHNTTTTGDKMEDIVVYLPQQQENPLPPAPTVEGDLEDGREVQAPEEHPPEHADVEAHDEPGPELRRSTRIRQPPGWYGDRIILPDKLA